jgi:putative membrane protein
VVWSVVSLRPTFHFLGWRQALKERRAPEVAEAEYRHIRLCLKVQLAILPLVPALAVFMARGYGAD